MVKILRNIYFNVLLEVMVFAEIKRRQLQTIWLRIDNYHYCCQLHVSICNPTYYYGYASLLIVCLIFLNVVCSRLLFWVTITISWQTAYHLVMHLGLGWYKPSEQVWLGILTSSILWQRLQVLVVDTRSCMCKRVVLQLIYVNLCIPREFSDSTRTKLYGLSILWRVCTTMISVGSLTNVFVCLQKWASWS